MNKIYTLIRPVRDYGETEITYAAFSTREDAEKARLEIIDFWNKLKEGVGPPTECENWFEWCNKLTDPIGKTWPYNSMGVYNYDVITNNSPEGCVEIRELPLY